MTTTDKVYKLRRWGWSTYRISLALGVAESEVKKAVSREKIAGADNQPLREIRRQWRIIQRFDKVGGI